MSPIGGLKTRPAHPSDCLLADLVSRKRALGWAAVYSTSLDNTLNDYRIISLKVAGVTLGTYIVKFNLQFVHSSRNKQVLAPVESSYSDTGAACLAFVEAGSFISEQEDFQFRYFQGLTSFVRADRTK